MGKNAPRLEDNPFYKARKAYSEKDPNFASREKASNFVNIEQTRLSKIESDKVTPYPEEVCSMAQAYHMPELYNIYCSDYCPIGMGRIEKHDISELDRIAFRILGSLKDAEVIQNEIIRIVEDGQITRDEYAQIQNIMEMLTNIENGAQALKLWVEKNLKLD